MAAIAPTEAPATWNSPAEIEVEEGVSVFIPNNQFTAHEVFTDKDFAEKCLTSVSTVLSSDGTLRFGVKGDGLQGNQWSVWADFRIYFNVAQASDLDPEIENLLAQVDEILLEGTPGGVRMAETKLTQAQTQGNTALNSDDATVKNAAINALADALAYAAKSVELGQKITNIYQDYEDREGSLDQDFVSGYTGFATLMNEIASSMYDEDFESNEQIEGWIESLSEEWLNYVLGWTALDAATIDNPVDMTMLITNPTFDNNNKDGWTVECESIGGTDADGCVEFWQSSAFDMYQVLPKLRAGFYRLEVDALYRAGNGDNEIGAVNAADSIPLNEMYLYASTQSTKIVQWSDLDKGALAGTIAENQELYPGLSASDYTMNSGAFCAPNSRAAFQTFIEAERYHNSVNFGYTEGPVKLGIIKFEAMSNDWAPIDNFALYYLGTEAPDAVKSIDAADASILAGKEIYNLAGQKVGKAQKGIYIIGGRKVVVK